VQWQPITSGLWKRLAAKKTQKAQKYFQQFSTTDLPCGITAAIPRGEHGINTAPVKWRAKDFTGLGQ